MNDSTTDHGPHDGIRDLLRPSAYGHPVQTVRLLETHISWLLLTGDFAYKVKKPVNLGFVDFSTLEQRLECCLEELRLNRRTAPDLYLDVVPIGAGPDGWKLGLRPAVEYAVRMRQFPAGQRLDELLDAGQLGPAALFEAGRQVAQFHEALRPWRVSPGSDPAEVSARPALNNLCHLRENDLDEGLRESLQEISAWTMRQASALEPVFRSRYRAGRLRDGHGDLHLGNIFRQGERFVPFDCLEFDPGLRRADVASDIAFLVMDLLARGRNDLAWACLNGWLEESGDYAALDVLRFYLVYRALVRAKVALVQSRQSAGRGVKSHGDLLRYLELADALTRAQPRPQLILMHGLSGSGKSWVSRRLMCRLPGVRVRSDVERKRLVAPRSSRPVVLGGDAYAPAATRRTYEALERAARQVLAAGYSVIVDATFGRRAQRLGFVQLAEARGTAPVMVHCRADPAILRQRLMERASRGDDVSDADVTVLESQRRSFEPPSAGEGIALVECRTDRDIDWEALCTSIRGKGRVAA